MKTLAEIRKNSYRYLLPTPQKDGNDYPTSPWIMEFLDMIMSRETSWNPEKVIDLSCSKKNRKYSRGFTLKGPVGFDERLPEGDSLMQDWHKHSKWGFCGAPYEKDIQGAFARKCSEEADKGMIIASLFQASTSTKWFHDYVYENSIWVPLKGRIKYIGMRQVGNFSNIVAIFGVNKSQFSIKAREEIRLMLQNHQSEGFYNDREIYRRMNNENI